MPGRIWDQIYEIAVDQHGFVTSAQVAAAGIDRKRLVDLAARGDLRRVGNGVYRMERIPLDRLAPAMEAVLCIGGRGVISHTTALDLYDICDVNPDGIHLTLPRGLQVRRRLPATYHIHRGDLAPSEVQIVDMVPVVTPARAIRECIDLVIGDELIDQAVSNARKQNLISEYQETVLAARRLAQREDAARRMELARQ